ncbi:7TM diverse intracellular signaling domain-containing protein [Pedobacter sp. L105]|uniref:sensor histidine kinase n=1 Tax=Pedobacter sp. L105 TaxID=1641871 RepID=UPI00131A77C3|nr:7TM diverse intracellular signaling domain-containing protein [Pedobacter sp. L105]
MTLKKVFSLLFLLITATSFAFAATNAPEIIVNNSQKLLKLDKGLAIFVDKSAKLPFSSIGSQKFEITTDKVPNLGITDATIWVKFNIRNQSDDEKLFLMVEQPAIDKINLYYLNKAGAWNTISLGEYKKYSERVIDNPNYIFPLDIPTGTSAQFYISVSSKDQIQLPMLLGSEGAILDQTLIQNLLFGMYAGIIIIMIIYNLFVSLTVRDSSYIYYIIYILFVGLTQFFFEGLAFKFLWPNSTWMANYSSILVPFFSGISTLIFTKKFLQTKNYTPKLDYGLDVCIALYSIDCIIGMSGNFAVAIDLLQLTALSASLYVLFVANAVRKKGYRPAVFFLIGYSIFLGSIVIFVLRNFNVIPYNGFTSYILEIASVIQITLLSFALADKINFFRTENEQAQRQALAVSKENERLIREQNAELEIQVNRRTEELQNSNSTLNLTLRDLKEAQSQLVDAEKMAGLGQLTAGIAHEINNPINFVTSNIKPLELDINDLYDVIQQYEDIDPDKDILEQIASVNKFKKQIDLDFIKTEINSLLSGIGEGAKRTAEIIRSLKNFSRLDESDTKPVDLNEGLESTMVLLRSTVPHYVKIIKDLKPLSLVECLPGKINQVFMNLMTNAIQAIKVKPNSGEEEFLYISTWEEDNQVKISIKDTGPGMTEEIKQKIFEPFFTTKEVGEGTGLGLSIVFSIIEKHKGHIDVVTKVNYGTEFIITLPVNNR